MLINFFVSEVRVKLLKILLPQPDKSFHVRALVRLVGTEINAVRRELNNLLEIGLLRKRQSSNKIYYTVDSSCKYYPELLSLISKEEGLGSKIIDSAKELGKVRYAVLSRAFTKGRESSPLDVDLLVVGKINLEVLDKIIKEEQKNLGKEINYTVLDEAEFLFRKRKNDQFITRVLSQSRTMLIGDEENFCALV